VKSTTVIFFVVFTGVKIVLPHRGKITEENIWMKREIESGENYTVRSSIICVHRQI